LRYADPTEAIDIRDGGMGGELFVYYEGAETEHNDDYPNDPYWVACACEERGADDVRALKEKEITTNVSI
jgi:hypothetical protein